jgi:hypothetical protein
MTQLLPGVFAVLPVAGPAGKLISIGEWLNGSAFGHYDHAEIYVGMADPNAPLGYTMGAYPGGARLVPVPREQKGWLWSTGRLDLTPAQRAQIVKNALACKGIGYSAADYFALAAHHFHVPIPGLREYIKNSGHMICSQLCDWCYMKAGVQLFSDGRWEGYVTPADLAGLLHA